MSSKNEKLDAPSPMVIQAIKTASASLISSGFNLREMASKIREVVPFNYDKTKEKACLQGLERLRGFKKERHDLNRICAAAFSAKGITGGIIQETHEFVQQNMIRNQGGGWIQSDIFKSGFRIVLYSDKGFAEFTGEELIPTLKLAFDQLHLAFPEGIK